MKSMSELHYVHSVQLDSGTHTLRSRIINFQEHTSVWSSASNSHDPVGSSVSGEQLFMQMSFLATSWAFTQGYLLRISQEDQALCLQWPDCLCLPTIHVEMLSHNVMVSEDD